MRRENEMEVIMKSLVWSPLNKDYITGDYDPRILSPWIDLFRGNTEKEESSFGWEHFLRRVECSYFVMLEKLGMGEFRVLQKKNERDFDVFMRARCDQGSFTNDAIQNFMHVKD